MYIVWFIWSCIICCSIANGIIWYFEEIPDVYVPYILIVCAVLIVVHRCYTKKWCDKNNMDDLPFIFIPSAVIALCIILFLMTLSSAGELGSHLGIPANTKGMHEVKSYLAATFTAFVFLTACSIREYEYS